MAKAKPRAKAKPDTEETVEAVETVETDTIAEDKAEVVKKEKPAAPKVPTVTIEVTRDEAGRVVFQVDGLPRRIAGADAVVPEVARQIGEELIKEKLI